MQWGNAVLCAMRLAKATQVLPSAGMCRESHLIWKKQITGFCFKFTRTCTHAWSESTLGRKNLNLDLPGWRSVFRADIVAMCLGAWNCKLHFTLGSLNCNSHLGVCSFSCVGQSLTDIPVMGKGWLLKRANNTWSRSLTRTFTYPGTRWQPFQPKRFVCFNWTRMSAHSGTWARAK